MADPIWRLQKIIQIFRYTITYRCVNAELIIIFNNINKNKTLLCFINSEL